MKKRFNIFREQIGLNKKESKEYDNLHTLLNNSEYWWIKDENKLEKESLIMIRDYIDEMINKIQL